MILVYGDESMDETKQRVCAIAGVFGTEEEWRSLEALWVERNRGVPFHATDCDSDRDDYKNRDHLENKALYRDLTIMLAKSNLKGVGVAIDLVALRAAFSVDLNMAYQRAFWQVIDTIEGFACENGDIAKLTFDTRMESDHNAAILYGNLREAIPGWKDTLASEISFVCSRDNPRIQIADLVARETMKVLDNIVSLTPRPTRLSWKALAATGRFEVYPFSTEWFESMKTDRDSKQAALTQTSAEYHRWLKETGRQDNTTNLMIYAGKRKHRMVGE